jgi:protein phosphatase
MTQTLAPAEVTLETAFVTDRGLSEKRPVNEDSYLLDAQRHLFIVADGVGGAQAGEVASQTAVEVLNEAFRFKLDDNDDIEDLMELAIQRANNSIYRMAQEHPDFSTMATTLVALHLRGLQATIGHVGDSRLYRLSPEGRLYRETQDHSLVEEEVRAGRMTAEQAANHPGRNVISRALGADSQVEVDMRTIPYEEGTTFLLCTDGITRHLSDTEICALLQRDDTAENLCAEMKRICYERGAEDNLTAVLIRSGKAPEETIAAAPPVLAAATEEEYTISTPRPLAEAAAPAYQAAAPPLAPSQPIEPPTPFAGALAAPDPRGGALSKILLALLFIGAVAGAFFGGMALRDKFAELTGWSVPGVSNVTASPAPPAVAPNVAQERAAFLSERKLVDDGAEAWMKKLDAAGVANPDAPTLYLRGRAYLLMGKPKEAAADFETALDKLRKQQPENPLLEMEARAALLRAHIDAKAEKPPTPAEIRRNLNDLLGLPQTEVTSPADDNNKSDK